MQHLLEGMSAWLKIEESNEYADLGLKFIANYMSSISCDTKTHPIVRAIFKFLLKRVSLKTSIRVRMCQFINWILSSMTSEANIDEDIFIGILNYMTERSTDFSIRVRLHAVCALQRLQDPEDPDDLVIKLYSFLLGNDPSVHVRQTIIKLFACDTLTLPIILKRLLDVDEGVRHTALLKLSHYPVEDYKVEERVMLLEQCLNDDSECVRNTMQSVLLPQWLQSYNKKYMKLIFALKMDQHPKEIQHFMEITKKILFILFK